MVPARRSGSTPERGVEHKAARVGAVVLLAGVLAVACSSAAPPNAAPDHERAGLPRVAIVPELLDARKLPVHFREANGKVRLIVLLSPT